MCKTILAAMLYISFLTRAHAEGEADFASPMVDRTLFRDGQVQRLTGSFGAWTALCDEVRGLKRRYCSLRSATVGDTGGRPVYADVSTGDDGRPAGLLHLPLGLSLRSGIVVRSGSSRLAGARGKAHATSPSRRTLEVVTCSRVECLVVWTLSPDDIEALASGAGLAVTYCLLPAVSAEFRSSLANKSCAVRAEAVIPGRGFQNAVLASTR